MIRIVACFLCLFIPDFVRSYNVFYPNSTLDPASQQLEDFRLRNPVSIGLATTTAGKPVEIRETISLNTDLFSNELHLDTISHFDAERVPERVVHAKGVSAFGYFEVTNDVSQYTNADVFNGVGKKTPVVARFSSALQSLGGNDLARELKGVAFKFYTKEGNLDLLCINYPVYFYRDPMYFPMFVRSFLRNPRTNLFDFTARWDFITSRPDTLHAVLHGFSDYGIPRGYRRMDGFPIHTYELTNDKGERYYVKFNFRTEQGLDNFTTAEAQVAARDLDYSTRDLYNAIELQNYPSWRLDMDVMTKEGIKKVDYNPFDVTRLWKNGTYHTVTIGRVVLNRNPDNHFRVGEQSAFNPANLVPGIPGPPDYLFKGRRHSYRDTQNHRLGYNHNNIEINKPMYRKTYTRNSMPPVLENMKDAPNYYPNSFNGPIAYVDETKPRERMVVFESNAVDLEPPHYFYNNVVGTDAHKQRLAANAAASLLNVVPSIRERALKLLTLTDEDLGRRTALALIVAQAEAAMSTTTTTTTTQTPQVYYKDFY